MVRYCVPRILQTWFCYSIIVRCFWVARRFFPFLHKFFLTFHLNFWNFVSGTQKTWFLFSFWHFCFFYYCLIYRLKRFINCYNVAILVHVLAFNFQSIGGFAAPSFTTLFVTLETEKYITYFCNMLQKTQNAQRKTQLLFYNQKVIEAQMFWLDY